MGILCGTYYYTCAINFKWFFYGKSSNEANLITGKDWIKGLISNYALNPLAIFGI